MRGPRFRRRSCHRSLSSLCRKRLATARRTVWIFLQALGDKPANRNRKRYDHDEDGSLRGQPACYLVSAPYAFLSNVSSLNGMRTGDAAICSRGSNHPLSQHGSLMANGVIDAPQRPSREYRLIRRQDRHRALRPRLQYRQGCQVPIPGCRRGHPAVRRSARSDDRLPA